MDPHPENIEFIKEFAQDCLEILKEQQDLLKTMRTAHESMGTVSGDVSSKITLYFRGIQNSSEFLGLDDLFAIAKETGDYYADRGSGGRMVDAEELEVMRQVLGCMEHFAAQLAENGVVENPKPETEAILGLIHEKLLQSDQVEEVPEVAPEPEVASVENFDAMFQIQITPEMLATYITEAEEQLEVTETSLLGLEKNLHDKELVDLAFRGIHTFKGNSGLFNYNKLEKLGHEFETILENFKEDPSKVDREGISMLLDVLDVFKAAVHDLPEGEGKVDDFDELMTMLVDYQSKAQINPNGDIEQGSTLIGEILVEQGSVDRPTLDQALNHQATPLGEVLKATGVVEEGEISNALKIQQQRRAAQAEGSAKRRSSAQNIRVDLYKLDALMNLVGELIIAENTVTHNPDLEGYEFQNFKKAALQLNRISRDLQDISLSLRMIPIEATFNKMVRVVRDVSHKQGKNVDLVMEGEDTEIDKSVVESLAGPLLHIIRNAIDHGIESPEERDRLEKPHNGIINLKAFHEGGEVAIEIRDDGKGIDKDKLQEKARQMGILHPGDEPTNDQEIFNLIFEPGFSTAEKVTDISGRGVGMDVVKNNIEDINGRVHITSTLGKGTCFSIRIPLTLAIIEGMLVRVGTQLFTIPLLSIRESIRTHMDAVSSTVDGSEMIRIRKELVPVVRLHELFDSNPDFKELDQGILVVVVNENKKLCLFADEILGQYQTVIKGLSSFLGAVRGISGTSIMSNGDISLILDIQSLVNFAIQKHRNL